MNLIALIFGLLIERLVAHLLHLREPRWMDRYFDWGLRRVAELGDWQAKLAAGAIIALPVLPVLLISLFFKPLLFGIVYLAFAVLILIFSLGPRDLLGEIDSFCEACNKGDKAEMNRIAKGLAEADLPINRQQRELAVEEAVLVQADNRIFAVVFWFAVLGPVGAWMFRVSDLFRRRRAFELNRDQLPDARRGDSEPVLWWHGILVWLPARMLAIGYAVVGSFDGAFAEWRAFNEANPSGMSFYMRTSEILAAVGRGALEQIRDDLETAEPQIRAARGAYRLVRRALLVWVFVIAVLTLLGWLV